MGLAQAKTFGSTGVCQETVSSERDLKTSSRALGRMQIFLGFDFCRYFKQINGGKKSLYSVQSAVLLQCQALLPPNHHLWFFKMLLIAVSPISAIFHCPVMCHGLQELREALRVP